MKFNLSFEKRKCDYNLSEWIYEEDGKLCKVIPKKRHRHWFNSPHITDYDKNSWYEIYRKRFNHHPNFIAIDNFELPNYFEMKKIKSLTSCSDNSVGFLPILLLEINDSSFLISYK